jgi:hypothetical protein
LIAACFGKLYASYNDLPWTDATGNWSDGNNWNTSSPPANGDTVLIINISGSPWTVTYNNGSGGTQTFNSLTVDAFGTNILQANQEIIGNSGTGVFTQTGGTNAVSGQQLRLGHPGSGSQPNRESL